MNCKILLYDILVYIAYSASNDKWAVKKTGVSLENADAISQLTPDEIETLSKAISEKVTISIIRGGLEAVLKFLEEKKGGDGTENTHNGADHLIGETLRYIQSLIHEGNSSRLDALGISKELIPRIKKVTLEQVINISGMPYSIIDILICEEGLSEALQILKEQKKNESMMHELISKDAPVEMITSLCDVSPRQVELLRRIPGGKGRPKKLEEDKHEELIRLLKERNIFVDDKIPELFRNFTGRMLLAKYLQEIEKDIGINLKQLWPIVARKY